jgi:hypothetical protein
MTRNWQHRLRASRNATVPRNQVDARGIGVSATGRMFCVLQPDLYNFLAVSSLISYAFVHYHRMDIE